MTDLPPYLRPQDSLPTEPLDGTERALTDPPSMGNPIADPLVENVIMEDVASVVMLDTTPDGVATVTINRPDTGNAIEGLVIEALSEVFETLQGAEGIRVVFLRGAGGTFSAGADLSWMRTAVDYTESDNRDDAMALATMLKHLSEIPALTVTLVEGGAMGAGAGLCAVSDYVVASEDARFAFSEVRLGLVPATIAPYVVNAIGPRAAKPLFVTGRLFDAQYAQAIGLVHEIASTPQVMDEIKARIVSEIMLVAPGAAADAKRLVWDVWGRQIDHGLMEETARRIARIRVGPEAQEGARAFLERRRPDWSV